MTTKQTTLGVFNETVTAPANQDFVFDGKRGELILNVFELTGTTPGITVTATELFEKGFTLLYDAQTVNFTIGRTVVGQFSNARGVIADDTDGGATGTLELKRVVGQFFDNEPLREEIAGVETSGAAVANGRLVRVLQEGTGVWCTITGATGDANAAFLNPEMAATEGDRGVVIPRRFRLKIVEVPTWATAKFAVDLLQSEV